MRKTENSKDTKPQMLVMIWTFTFLINNFTIQFYISIDCIVFSLLNIEMKLMVIKVKTEVFHIKWLQLINFLCHNLEKILY